MTTESVYALVPVWRTDTAAARRLYGFSDDLSADDIHKAVEQVRFQRQGQARAPLWLQALAGFAWAQAQPAQVHWQEQDEEREVLLALVKAIDTQPEATILVFSQAADLAQRLRLRLLLQGLAPQFANSWDSRLRDGQAWQPEGLSLESDAAAAVLSLATTQNCYDPWQTSGPSPQQACQQAQALCELWQRGWL
nr:hypothetical protein [Oceanococcus sp. HetDA_MAG_MS8]